MRKTKRNYPYVSELLGKYSSGSPISRVVNPDSTKSVNGSTKLNPSISVTLDCLLANVVGDKRPYLKITDFDK